MRIRTVKPEFWTHETLAECSLHARLLAIALLNYADDEGYFRADARLVRAACFPFDDDSSNVRRSLDELSNIGYCRIVEASNGRRIGHICSFKEHQRVDRGKPSKLAADFAEVANVPASNPSDLRGENAIDEQSTTDRRRVGANSPLEQGTGNREGEQGTGNREVNNPPAQAHEKRFDEQIVDGDLAGPAFRAAWHRWVGWVDSQSDRPMNFARAERDLMECSRRGRDKAIRDIEFTIAKDGSRRLLDSDLDFDRNERTTAGSPSTTRRRGVRSVDELLGHPNG